MLVSNGLFIQMSGAPGSGKTTIAKLLAKEIHAVIIDYDILKTSLLEGGLPFDQSGRLAYHLQWSLAEEMMRQSHNVIIDSPCNFQRILDAGTELATKHAYHYRYVECRVQVKDLELLDKRLGSRVPLRSQRTGVNHPPSDAISINKKISNNNDDVDFTAIIQKWIEQPYRPKENIIVLDSISNSPDTCVKTILANLYLSDIDLISEKNQKLSVMSS